MTHSIRYKIIDFLFQAIAVRQYLIFSGCFFVLTALVMFILDAQIRPPGCPGMIPLELAFTKGTLGDIVTACGAEGVRTHQIMIWVDYIFIISYVGFLGNLLGSLVRHIEYEKALLYFSLPIYAGVLDIIENTLLLIELSDTTSLSGALIFLASLAALVKFILLFAAIVLTVYYLYELITKKSHP
jgi:hypothetical protein